MVDRKDLYFCDNEKGPLGTERAKEKIKDILESGKKEHGYFIFEYKASTSNIIRNIQILTEARSFPGAVEALKSTLFSANLDVPYYCDTPWHFFGFRVYFEGEWHEITTDRVPILHCKDGTLRELFNRQREVQAINFSLKN